MEFKQVIESRRAVNFFDPLRDISDEQIKQVVEAAAKAPSSFNLQPWSVIILRDKDEKLRLQKHAWDQPKVSEAPVTMIVLADMDGWQAGHHFVEKDFDSLVKIGMMSEERRDQFYNACKTLYGASGHRKVAFACKNAGFFAMALMLAAKDIGIDTHPMDGFDLEGVMREFNIPDNYWVPLLIAAGHFRSDMTLPPYKWRKSFDEISVKFD